MMRCRLRIVQLMLNPTSQRLLVGLMQEARKVKLANEIRDFNMNLLKWFIYSSINYYIHSVFIPRAWRNMLHSALEGGILAEIVPGSLKKGGYCQNNLASLNCLRTLALSPSGSDKLIIVKVISISCYAYIQVGLPLSEYAITIVLILKQFKYLVYIKLYMSFAINFFIHLS